MSSCHLESATSPDVIDVDRTAPDGILILIIFIQIKALIFYNRLVYKITSFAIILDINVAASECLVSRNMLTLASKSDLT